MRPPSPSRDRASRCQHREDVVADDLARVSAVRRHRLRRRVVGEAERRRDRSQPTYEQRPDQGRAPVPSSQNARGPCAATCATKKSSGSTQASGVSRRRRHGAPEEVRDERVAVLGQHRLGVELHAVQRALAVLPPPSRPDPAARHTRPSPRGRRARDGGLRVVAHRREVLRQPSEDAGRRCARPARPRRAPARPPRPRRRSRRRSPACPRQTPSTGTRGLGDDRRDRARSRARSCTVPGPGDSTRWV